MQDPDLPTNRRILIVAGDPAIHDDYRRALAPADPGFQLSFAFDGPEALGLAQAARSTRRPFSVAFADSLETMVLLREADPELQVVIWTMRGAEVLDLAHALADKWQLGCALEVEVRRREQAEARLRHAQRLEALGRLAGGIAHEINNPLSFVLANLSFIREVVREVEAPVDLHEDLVKAAADAFNGADRIRRIVRDVRAFTRAESACLQPVNLRKVAERAAELARPVAGGRATVALQIPGDLAVMGAEEALVQVLYNLLANAVQAMPDGKVDGRIQLSARPGPGGHVQVEVADNGSGIRPEHMPRLFEPFFTTRGAGQGTGLGLCICQGLVQKMGGRLAVESDVGVGTTFAITLRPAPEAADSARQGAAA
ncbi:MAG TPA: ATP-binding protein [Myxococcales bacterium]|nr:ATP-binding protein [Myxococcales bacterium]